MLFPVPQMPSFLVCLLNIINQESIQTAPTMIFFPQVELVVSLMLLSLQVSATGLISLCRCLFILSFHYIDFEFLEDRNYVLLNFHNSSLNTTHIIWEVFKKYVKWISQVFGISANSKLIPKIITFLKSSSFKISCLVSSTGIWIFFFCNLSK